MTDLNSYLKEKLKKVTPKPPQQFSLVPVEVVSVKNRKQLEIEEDYSPGSPFWKNTLTKKEPMEHSIQERVEEYLVPNTPEVQAKSSVSVLLRKLKDSKSIETLPGEPQKQSEKDNSLDIVSRDIEIASHSILRNMGTLNTLVNENFSGLFKYAESNDKLVQELRQDTFKQIKDIEKIIINNDKYKAILDAINKQQEIILKMESKLNTSPAHEINSTKPYLQSLDRPTINLISGMNDKLIQLTKQCGHFNESQEMKLNRIEKHLTGVKNKELDNRKLSSHCSREDSDYSDNEELVQKLDLLQRDLELFKHNFENESRITNERMNQFMSMFSILEDAHVKLIEEKFTENMVSTVLEMKNEQKQIKQDLMHVKDILLVIKRQNAEILSKNRI